MSASSGRSNQILSLIQLRGKISFIHKHFVLVAHSVSQGNGRSMMMAMSKS